MILYYDGSLSGYLCLLGTAVKERLMVKKVFRHRQATTIDMLTHERTITTDGDWAATVAAGLQKKLGNRFMMLLAKALYSEQDGIEYDLILLTRHALHHGRKLLANPANPLVNRIEKAALLTSRERHRLLGFVRFRLLSDGSYLSCCSPRTNAVPLLGHHFSKRLGEQRWLILDEQRDVGVLGEAGRWQVVEQIEIAPQLTEDSSEQQVTDLWRAFYHNTSNRDRHNPKLRRQSMPQRYWRYLTEMKPGQR